MNESPITPQTTVAELLDAHPQLEGVLIGMAPAFHKLKNPVLRRTVAKLASLETAAGMAKLKPRDLVRKLRESVGQPLDDLPGDDQADERETEPVWIARGAIAARGDADAWLAQGLMPLAEILRLKRMLAGGNLLCIRVSFKPTPLEEALKKQGFRTFLRPGPGNGYELLIAPAAG